MGGARRAQEAREAVEAFLRELGLTLCPEKTRATSFRKGFTFRGFDVASHSVTMRAKSVEKYKARVRELTQRHHNLDAARVQKLNAVIRGVAQYFATAFSHGTALFREWDRWLRMRLRCMKYKRKSRQDNSRLKVKHIRRLGLVFLSDFVVSSGGASG